MFPKWTAAKRRETVSVHRPYTALRLPRSLQFPLFEQLASFEPLNAFTIIDSSTRFLIMPPKPGSGPSASGPTSHTSRAQASSSQPDSSSSVATQQNGGSAEGGAQHKKRRRGGRRHKKDRRQSFAAPSESEAGTESLAERPALATVQEGQQSSSFYKLGNRADSNTSLESEALLDHR